MGDEWATFGGSHWRVGSWEDHFRRYELAHSLVTPGSADNSPNPYHGWEMQDIPAEVIHPYSEPETDWWEGRPVLWAALGMAFALLSLL